MYLQNSHIENIRQANEEDRLALFVGAGVSKSSDSDYIELPLWDDLINELKSDLALTKEIDYLKLAQLYYLEFGEQKYTKTLKKYFPSNIMPSDLHRTLLKLNPQVIITTNWDCIIENAIDQGGYLYETISTDQDLVKSTSQRKFIKIHGDFKSHNIVFKEDDYLNYSNNFPLMENYIKSIFSTHTVLFLGYSYNDTNLKYLMKWVQNHSNSAPPMYLVSFDSNRSQENYLKSHGITTLVLDGSRYSVKNIKNLRGKSALMQSFLKSIIHNENTVDVNSEQEVISFFYDCIKHLKPQNAISHHQLRRAITNCGFHYDCDGLSILELYGVNGVQTTDSSSLTRLIHDEFIKILVRIDNFSYEEKEIFYQKNSKFKDIFYVLSLARVKGVVLPRAKDDSHTSYFYNELIRDPEEIEKKDRKYLSFSNNEYKGSDFIKSLASESYENYVFGEHKLAFNKNTELIMACKRQRIYSVLLIALFNKNSILWTLKYSLFKTYKERLDEEKEVELQDEFFKFPKSEIKKNQTLYDFLSLLLVYQQANECTQKILNLTKIVKNIKDGGFSFNNDADEPTYTHINLLMFTLKNHILIDKYAPYKALMRDFVKISIIRQSVKSFVEFNQYEIYTAIQFFTTKELRAELSVFSKKDDSSQLRFVVSNDCSEWIVSTVLSNIVDRLIKNESLFDSENGSRFENCMQILAVLSLSADQVSEIMGVFSKLIASRSTTIGVYEAINSFLSHQYNLFDQKIETEVLINVLNILIDKITSHNAHGWDHHAIQNNSISNLYGYIQITKGIYTDTKRIHQLVSELQACSLVEQRSFAKSLLYEIFTISNDSVKSIIEKYIKEIIFKGEVEGLDNIEFDLWSVAVGFKDFEDEITQNLDGYLEEFRTKKIFSSTLYKIKNLTKYLIENKGVEELKEIDGEISTLIAYYENRPNPSSI
ncbi:SIR2 family protein [uncultured Paenalcaligenes sp.]|uniref:SIR2 family protein n=1 Tax=uncultured Paenalcaligenes sp. TaxID=1588925 RepID=UPI00262D79C7|nr:SIR2 family protein [uncultured Paenalcaligenes sp.]